MKILRSISVDLDVWEQAKGKITNISAYINQCLKNLVDVGMDEKILAQKNNLLQEYNILFNQSEELRKKVESAKNNLDKISNMENKIKLEQIEKERLLYEDEQRKKSELKKCMVCGQEKDKLQRCDVFGHIIERCCANCMLHGGAKKYSEEKKKGDIDGALLKE